MEGETARDHGKKQPFVRPLSAQVQVTWLSGVLYIKLSHKANNSVLNQLKENTSVLILILYCLLIGPTEEPVLPGAVLSTSFVKYLYLHSYNCKCFSHITLKLTRFSLHTL